MIKDTQEKEEDRLAELQKQQAQKAEQQNNNVPTNTQTNVQPKIIQPQTPTANNFAPVHSEFEKLNDYLASTPEFKNISQNNRVKCQCLYEYFLSLIAKNGHPLSKLIGTDPDEVIKNIQHIINM